MATANGFFALLTLATNVGLVLLLVLVVSRPHRRLAAYRRRMLAGALPMAAAVAVVSTLGSLYYSEIAGLRPCRLCWYQRGAMYPLAVLLVVGVVTRPRWLWKVALPLASVGAVMAAYHYLIQWQPSLAFEAACTTDVPCTAAEIWQFGFMSMAYMALSGFVLIATLLWFGARRQIKDDRRATVAGRRDTALTVTSALAVAGVAAALFAPGAPPAEPTTPDVQVAAPAVGGEPLPPLEDPQQDAAAGSELPDINGSDYTGSPVEISDDGRAKIVMVVAHWCGFCQQEIPEIQDWIDANGMPQAVDLYSVSTAEDPSAPNYPPAQWLEREGWEVPVVVDDDEQSVATAVGVSGYPFFVFVAADGTVVGRHAGQLGVDAFTDVVASLSGAGPPG